MTKRTLPISLVLGWTIALSLIVGGSGCGSTQTNGNNATLSPTPTPTGTPITVACGTASEMQVVDAIYAVLKQQPYYKEMWQFNITVKEDPATKVKTTTITGWSEHKTEIETIAKNTAQGCTYNAQSPFVLTRDELLPQYRISCPPNMAPCGDICIQIGDYCKLTQLEAKAPPTPVGSPTATPVVAVNPNSNTGSNSNTNTKKY